MNASTDLFRLDGQSVIVTGASSGLGARFAQTVAAAGARVVLGARRIDRLEDLVSTIVASGGEALPVKCDVTVEEDVRRLIATCVDRFGGVDVLVNNAGVAPAEDAQTETLDSFRKVVAVNLEGIYSCAREVGSAMLQAGKGSIVNTASISGLVAGDGPDTPSYVASKGAIISLTRELAVRWAQHGVRVNALAPGYFPSEMTEGTLQDDQGREFVEARTPMGRAGRPAELDGALLFLASSASSYVTGVTIPVDGGWTAR